jgi:phosphoglycerate dehydrogenase-like enzyme
MKQNMLLASRKKHGPPLRQILVTDDLFIQQVHVKRLQAAGFVVERLNKAVASEAELIKALQGKVGYILGGVEQVTDRVIEAADQLKAIAFTGIGYEFFIPAWRNATKKGIAITNTPEGPTQEVAEWAITAALIMNRRFLELGLVGKLDFAVTKGIETQSVGIIGLGRIGTIIAEMLVGFRPKKIFYYSAHRQIEKEQYLNTQYLELAELLKSCDIVFVCTSDKAKNLINKTQLDQMKKNTLLVNITHPGVINENALLSSLESGHIRAISDFPMDLPKFKKLPLGSWYSMKSSSTITEAGAKLMSDMATDSLINLLTTGEDKNLVNPEYINYRAEYSHNR